MVSLWFLVFLMVIFAVIGVVVSRNPRRSTVANAGAALMELNAIAQPKTYHTIEAIQMRPLLQEEDGEGDGDKRFTVRVDGSPRSSS